MGLTLSSHRPDQSATAHPDPEAWLTHEDGNSAWAVVKMPEMRERTRRRAWPKAVNRNLLVLGIGALLFVTVVYAAGQSESVRGALGGWTPAPDNGGGRGGGPRAGKSPPGPPHHGRENRGCGAFRKGARPRTTNDLGDYQRHNILECAPSLRDRGCGSCQGDDSAVARA